MQQFLKWNVDISIDSLWIEDGFDLTEDRLIDALQKILPFACSNELRAKIKTKPSEKIIKQLQGGI